MNRPFSRRDFLAASAAGIGVMASTGFVSAFGEEYQGGWENGMRINPAIDNFRVVNCCDPAMVSVDPKTWDAASQNAPVNAARVRANLEAMACALAQKAAAAEAWAAIFRKPDEKQWADVKVAVKPNSDSKNITRIAVIDTVCRALMGLGIKAENIVLYGYAKVSEDQTRSLRPFVGKGLPEGIVLSRGHDAMGGIAKAAIPKPHAGSFACAASLANGSIDILVNLAVNKGHMLHTFGGISLTMKNHAGTFEMPLRYHMSGGLNYIIAFNKSEAILGGTPPRQQLCVVDSIFANTSGPDGVPNRRPCCLTMGTFGPAVDWLVAKKIREPIMGCKHPKFLANILIDFGYETSTFANLDFVKVEPA
jgi:hypothetical protein